MTWHDINEGFAFWGIKLSLLLSSTVGAVLSVRKKKKMKFWQKLIAGASGVAAAMFITPFIMMFINIAEGAEHGVSFLIGYMGMESVELIIKTVKEKRDKLKTDAQ